MPLKSPRFWLEILILGFLLVFGMATLQAWFAPVVGSILRVLWAAALFGVYALHYERTWNQNDQSK